MWKNSIILKDQLICEIILTFSKILVSHGTNVHVYTSTTVLSVSRNREKGLQELYNLIRTIGEVTLWGILCS